MCRSTRRGFIHSHAHCAILRENLKLDKIIGCDEKIEHFCVKNVKREQIFQYGGKIEHSFVKMRKLEQIFQ